MQYDDSLKFDGCMIDCDFILNPLDADSFSIILIIIIFIVYFILFACIFSSYFCFLID